MHWPIACCSAELGCLVPSSSYNCWPNTPIRQVRRVGLSSVNGLSNAAPEPGESGASVVLAGRVPGVGRVGVGGEVVDVVVAAAGASVVEVVLAGTAAVVLRSGGRVVEVVVAATVVVGASVASGAAVSEPPAHAEAATARMRKTAVVRIGQVWHEAGCMAGAMP